MAARCFQKNVSLFLFFSLSSYKRLKEFFFLEPAPACARVYITRFDTQQAPSRARGVIATARREEKRKKR